MSEMIQKVARAIRRNKFYRTGMLSILDPSIISDEEMGEARAAIEAMREPTRDMYIAGVHSLHDDDRSTDDSADCWRSMIDAALTETDPVGQGN